MKDDISVDTASTGSLSELEGESVDGSPLKTTIASSNRFFKAKAIKLTEQRLQRSDAREAQAINVRLAKIHQEKEANSELIDTNQKNLDLKQEPYKQLLDAIAQAAELKNTKENENKVLMAKEREDRQTIGLMHEKTGPISTPRAVWRNFYTAIYHAFGWKTEYETLCERRDKLSLEMEVQRNIIKTNTIDIKELGVTQLKYDIRLSNLKGLILLFENDIVRSKKRIEILKKEETGLIQELPKFKNKSEDLNQAVSRMIVSCDELSKPSMLSRMQRTKVPISPQAVVAQALSDFLNTPTETMRVALASSMQNHPAYTEEPKLQALLEEAKLYYEIGEMPERDVPKPNM